MESGKAYDYQSPKLGKLSILYQSFFDDPGLCSSVHIVNEITDRKSLLNTMRKVHKGKSIFEQPNEEILTTAEFSKPYQCESISLDWIVTQESARRAGLARLALGLGVVQSNLADDAILDALCASKKADWNQRADFYNSLGFDNVPEKSASSDTFLIMPKITIKIAKLKRINLDMLKPNSQLTDCMMEYEKAL